MLAQRFRVNGVKAFEIPEVACELAVVVELPAG
jgi:hypothetical protein